MAVEVAPLQIVRVEMVDLEAVVQTGKDLDLELLGKVMMVVTQVALLAVAVVEEKVVLEAQQQV